MACIHSQCIPCSRGFPVCWTGSYSWALRHYQAHSFLELEQSEHDLKKKTRLLLRLLLCFSSLLRLLPDWACFLVNNTLLHIVARSGMTTVPWLPWLEVFPHCECMCKIFARNQAGKVLCLYWFLQIQILCNEKNFQGCVVSSKNVLSEIQFH